MAEYDFTMPDEERKRAAWMALAQASAGLLGAPRGREFQALGQGVQQGLLSYGDAQSQWQKAQQEQMKMRMAQEVFATQQEERQMRIAEAKRMQDQQEAQQRAASGAFVGGIPQMGPPTQQGEMSPSVAPQFNPQAYIQSLVQHGLPQEAIAASMKFQPTQKEIKETRTLMQNGKRVTVNIYKDGSHEVLPYAPDAEKAHFADAGSGIVPLDPYTGVPVGTAVTKGQSPDSKASNALGWANYGLAKDRSVREASPKPQWDASSGQFVMPPSAMAPGSATAPTGFVTKPDLDAAGMKELRTNEATLAKIDTALVELNKYPNAVGGKNVIGDSVMQRLDPRGVNVRRLVADIAGQKILDRSGAAVSVGEAERLKPYVPNVTDTESVVRQKLLGFQTEYQQMQRELVAGKSLIDVIRKRNAASSLGTAGGWSIQEVR